MMELGATVCLPKKPLCDACPVRTHCRARTLANSHAKPAPSIESKGKLGLGGDVAEEVCSQCKLDGDGAPPDIESFPFKEPKKKQTEESFVVVVPRRGDARYVMMINSCHSLFCPLCSLTMHIRSTVYTFVRLLALEFGVSVTTIQQR